MKMENPYAGMKTMRKFNGEMMKAYVVKKNGSVVETFRNIATAMRFAGVVGGSVEIREVTEASEIEEKVKLKCPRCGSSQIRLNGKILKSGGETTQRYQCSECGYSFQVTKRRGKNHE